MDFSEESIRALDLPFTQLPQWHLLEVNLKGRTEMSDRCSHNLRQQNWGSLSHLKLHHGLLHALHIKDHLDQLLDGFGQLGLGPCCGRQPLHRFLILLEKHNKQTLENPKHLKRTYKQHRNQCCVHLYLSIVDLQGIELVGIFGEIGGAPLVTSLLFVDGQEVVHGRVLVTELVQLVASDGGAHSAPRPEHPVPACAKGFLLEEPIAAN